MHTPKCRITTQMLLRTRVIGSPRGLEPDRRFREAARRLLDMSRRRGLLVGAGLATIALLAASPALAADSASFVSQSVPGSMRPGAHVSVSLTFTNTGTAPWNASGGYFLGSPNPDNGGTWEVSSIALPSEVAPGSNVTFNFGVTAPATPGIYDFQWQMERGVTFFGARSINVSVKVEAGPAG